MRASAAIAVVLTGLGLAACGSANTDQTIPTVTDADTATATVSAGPTVTTTGNAPVSTSAGTSPVSTTGAATISTTSITNPDSGGAALTTATTTTAGTSECVAGNLTLAAVGPNSAPGTAVLGFTLKNSGATSCHTGGWPGVALYAAGASQPLTTSATRSTSDVLGSTPETAIVLAPGDEASFRLVLSSSGGAGCHTATQAQFIAPNDTAEMSVTIPDGAEYCGSATVSPLEPGATGTGQ